MDSQSKGAGPSRLTAKLVEALRLMKQSGFDEPYWLGIISGKDRSLKAGLLRGLLWFASPLYGLAVRLRNFAFNRGWKQMVPASLPIISIGNLTTGGTGKSPLVIWLAEQLRGQGRRVCVLSRGYKGLDSGENDESLELAARLPDVPQLINPDRVSSAQIAVDELEMEVAILDDGFQHRRLRRDFDLVLIDATQPFGFGQLLPRGLLREPKSSLRRATRVVITRANLVNPEQLQRLKQELALYQGEREIAVCVTAPRKLLQADGRTFPLEPLAELSVFAFCGLGNPKAFFRTVEPLSARLAGEATFADHHLFSSEDLEAIADRARLTGAQAIVCSHKDLVKIGRNQLGELPLYALLIEVSFLSGEQSLLDAMNVCLPGPE